MYAPGTHARKQARDSLMHTPNWLPPRGGGACVGLHLPRSLTTQGSTWFKPPSTPPVPDLTGKTKCSLLLSGEYEIMTNK